MVHLAGSDRDGHSGLDRTVDPQASGIDNVGVAEVGHCRTDGDLVATLWRLGAEILIRDDEVLLR